MKRTCVMRDKFYTGFDRYDEPDVRGKFYTGFDRYNEPDVRGKFYTGFDRYNEPDVRDAHDAERVLSTTSMEYWIQCYERFFQSD